MHLRLTRLDERRYQTEITRADGVTYLVKGVGHMGVIPHDLAHFVVERTLGIRQGFWGSVAAGALFESLTHLTGRRRPHAEQRSKDVLKRNKGVLTETEILVGLFNQAFEEGLGADVPALVARLRRYTWTAPARQPRTYTEAQVSDASSEWSAMQRRWDKLMVGETLELEWPEG